MQQRSRRGFDDIFDWASDEQKDHQEDEAGESADADAGNHDARAFDCGVGDLWTVMS